MKYRVGERAVAGRQLDQISIGAASRIHTSARFRFTRSGTLTDELQRDSEITAKHRWSSPFVLHTRVHSSTHHVSISHAPETRTHRYILAQNAPTPATHEVQRWNWRTHL